MVGPKNFIRTATQLRKVIDTQGDSLMENAVAQLYEDGTIARHIKKSVKIYKERRDNFCNLLTNELDKHISFKAPDGGMSVWVKFLTVDLINISELALKKGLILDSGRKYNTSTHNYNSARLGFASLNFQEQKRAVEILKICILECLKKLNSK